MAAKELETEVVGMGHRVTLHSLKLLMTEANMTPIPVTLVREPMNPKDENAIKVVTGGEGRLRGMHVGYLPRGVAAKIAPSMKRGTLTVKSAEISNVRPNDGEADLKIRFVVRKTGSKKKT